MNSSAKGSKRGDNVECPKPRMVLSTVSGLLDTSRLLTAARLEQGNSDWRSYPRPFLQADICTVSG